MRAFFEIFRLEVRGFVRSRAWPILAAAGVAWMFAAPHFLRGDGTAAGAAEMSLRYSLGGVAALLSVSLLAAACGSLAGERAARRLALTCVRPVRPFVLALAKIAALAAIGASLLAPAAAVEWWRVGPDRRCDVVLRPVMPSPAEEAKAMYDAYLADPETPEPVRKASRGTVLRILEQRAWERYDSIATNATWTWRFGAALTEAPADGLAVRLRCSNLYSMRDEVRGVLATARASASLTNLTQAIVRVPLAAAAATGVPADELRFTNAGARPVMLRPRRDVEVLLPGGSMRANVVRAYLELCAMLTVLVAFGVFLGAGLARPVAVFTAVVLLAVGEMAPSVLESNPGEIESSAGDRIGLALTRFTARVTRPVGALHPLEDLSNAVQIPTDELLRIAFTHVLVLPLALAFLTALVLPRKQTP